MLIVFTIKVKVKIFNYYFHVINCTFYRKIDMKQNKKNNTVELRLEREK